MKSKKTTLLILIVLASLIPRIGALTPQEQTIHITDTHDDAFITEVGIKIDAYLCHVKDPNMDLHAFLVFRELEVNYWEPLENATLRLRTASPLSFDADSAITIYGMKMAEIQDLGWLTPSDVLSVGYTSAYVNYNTSEFYGSQWWEIDVTEIVEELIRHPHWDGDGISGSETGDAIGLHILGEEGFEKRYFTDFKAGDGYEAQLIIHWNHEPPPPSGAPNAVFNSTYRGYHIWELIPKWMNYTDWDEVDALNKIDVFNSSYVNLGTQFLGSITANLNNGTRGPYDTGSWRFGIMVSDLSDVKDDKIPIVHVHALGYPGYKSGFRDYYSINDAIGFGITDYNDQTHDRFYFGIEVLTGGARYMKFSPSWYSVNSSRWFWVEISYNCSAQDYIVKVYNDFQMTDLEVDLNRTGYAHIRGGGYDCEFAVIGQDYAIWNCWMEGALKSMPGEGTTWIVTDENGTTIEDGIPDYSDSLIVIEEILGADPEDPDPPGESWDETGPFTRFRMRFYFLIMGLFMLFGPLFTFAYRRPSGYAFVIGLFIMMVGFSFLIHVGSV